MKCPLCNSASVSYTLKETTYEIWSCENCKNGFTIPQPELLPYDNMDFHASEIIGDDTPVKDFNSFSKTLKKSYFINLKMILSNLQPGSTILEVGSGEGLLAELLQARNYKVVCIEPSVTACKRAQKRGLNVHQGYFPHQEVTGQFDLIVMTQVLEHIPSPINTLEFLKKQLAPGGLLLLNQTNYKSLITKIQGKNWYGWVPHQHFWHFTPKGLEELASPFRLKKISCVYSNLVSLGRKEKLIRTLASLIPSLQDQFHILFKNINEK